MSGPILIVGGGPAALATARAYRDAGGDGPVLLVTDEDRPPYERPPLTKDFLRGEVGADALPLEDDAWFAEHDIELVFDEVVGIDPEAHSAHTASGRGLRFDAAVLATGARPTRPPVPGADEPGVHVLRRAADSEALRELITPGLRVAVVGSGFIGCEAAASLARVGAQVTLVSDEPAPQTRRLGPEVAERIAGWLAEDGVALRLGHPVVRILRRDEELHVSPAVGAAVAADVVVLGAGIAPRDELARDAGLRLGPEDRQVRVDETMASSRPAIRAVGDVALARHAVAGRHVHVEHWGDALAHGEVAGRALAGDATARWDGAPGFWSTIGAHTLKQAAWGDGHDEVSFFDHGAGAFTARYYAGGRLVGVLTHERDADYEAGGDQLLADAR